MLESQRALFDMPREVCYLNAAARRERPKPAGSAIFRTQELWTIRKASQ